jgi:hypothetical protein
MVRLDSLLLVFSNLAQRQTYGSAPGEVRPSDAALRVCGRRPIPLLASKWYWALLELWRSRIHCLHAVWTWRDDEPGPFQYRETKDKPNATCALKKSETTQ